MVQQRRFASKEQLKQFALPFVFLIFVCLNCFMVGVRRAFEPGRLIELPVDVSGKTRVFLNREDAAAMDRDVRFISTHHQDFKPLTLPSKLTVISPAIQGKYTEVLSHYAAKAGFMLKRMTREQYDQTVRLNNALRARGKPTEKILDAFPTGQHLEVLVERTGKSMFKADLGQVAPERFKEYLSTLGLLHSLGWQHNHPHLNNTFIEARSGRLGLFDFSLAKKADVNWQSPHSVFKSFETDYDQALHMFVRFAASSDPVFEKLRKHQIQEFTGALVSALPASAGVKQEVQKKLEARVYERVIPYLQQHGYFEHKKRVTPT